jgi:hypothetical protein
MWPQLIQGAWTYETFFLIFHSPGGRGFEGRARFARGNKVEEGNTAVDESNHCDGLLQSINKLG